MLNDDQTIIESLKEFFDGIREYGETYSELLAEGDTEGAAEAVAAAEEEYIEPFIASSTTGSGNINMTNSSIQTVAENADIYILANGDVNVGLTRIPEPGSSDDNDTGIFTTRGGAINIFAVNDVNVNESRVMTFLGGGDDEDEDGEWDERDSGMYGDITVWSDQGDINAGRGSRTAINASSPTVKTIENDDGTTTRVIEWEVPAVGSGIRTLTYDPDGFLGDEEEPPAGNAYLFAPEGVIDAGEAGISAENLVLGATEVLNAQNIDVAGTSVGVPQTNAGPSIGALAGAGTVSETSRIVEESAAMTSAEDRFNNYVSDISDQLVPKWISVEVIGFENDKEDEENSNK